MPEIIAKYKCSSVNITSDQNGELAYSAELVPVVIDTEKNDKFFSDTPTGTIRLPFLQKEVSDLFIPGKDFYVQFIPID